jgi:glycerol uptake facilitator-like aquaporin
VPRGRPAILLTSASFSGAKMIASGDWRTHPLEIKCQRTYTPKLVAEFIGTFALIFIGAGAAIALGVNHDPPVAFAHGLTILVFVPAFGDISGGHFTAVRSPSRLAPFAIGMAITLCILGFGALTGGSINPARTIGPAVAAGLYGKVPIYVAAQLVVAIFAGALYRRFWVQQRTPAAVAVQSRAAAE